jgi:hypothetical protein
MFTPILEVCPSFRATWDEFVDEWKDDPDGLPQYLALSDLARHVIEMLERNETDGVNAIFGVVETWHLDGDPYVKEAATVGFLEDIQNTGLHNGSTTPNDFLEFLLPETKYWWSKVEDFWGQGKVITDDRTRN